MLRVKWENIVGLIFGFEFISCIVKHINKNGFDFTLVMYELMIYGFILIAVCLGIRSLRKTLMQ